MTIRTCGFPAQIVFGEGALCKLPELIPSSVRKILLVLGRSAAGMDSVSKTADALKAFSPEIVTGVPAEPPLPAVDEIIQIGRAIHAEAVAAIGGGSVIDAAKAAAALIPLEGTVSDYFSGKKNIPGKGLFFAACPTTAGTGAESTNNSVLTDPETKVKKSLRHPCMKADAAIVDPLLTLTCPKSLTAASGLDAFVQAFEAFTNPKATVLSKALSAEAAKLILKNLNGAYEKPDDLAYRTAMAEGSMLSGLGFSQTGLGAVHGLAHPVGSLLHVPHGMACAILMIPVMRWNMSVCEKDYAELAIRCGIGKTAEDFVHAAETLKQTLNVPETFRDWKIKESDFDFIIRNCRSASMNANPREMSDGDVYSMLKTLL